PSRFSSLHVSLIGPGLDARSSADPEARTVALVIATCGLTVLQTSDTKLGLGLSPMVKKFLRFDLDRCAAIGLESDSPVDANDLDRDFRPVDVHNDEVMGIGARIDFRFREVLQPELRRRIGAHVLA